MVCVGNAAAAMIEKPSQSPAFARSGGVLSSEKTGRCPMIDPGFIFQSLDLIFQSQASFSGE